MEDVSLLAPIGVSGLRQWSGYIDEEFLRPLRRTTRIRTYNEMATDPMIGASLLAITTLIRQATWTVQPADDSLESQREAEFVRTVLFEDMNSTWQETLSTILSMLTYGWSVHELVYKRRRGENLAAALNSQYEDGRYGLQGLEIRSQDTLQRWNFDTGQRLVGLWQQPWQGGGLIHIPEGRFVNFRMRMHKDSPEGLSLIRNCYVPWYYKKRIAEYEAIGIERDLAGLPVIRVPQKILDSTTPEHAAQYAKWRAAVQGIRRNENEGLLMPSDRDENGHLYYEALLLNSGGQRQFNTTAIIQQKNQEIVIALFTDVLLIGHEKVGSFALASSKTTLFATALATILTSIQDTINRVVIPRLWRVNGIPMRLKPTVKHGDIEAVDLAELGTFIAQMSGAGLDVLAFEQEVWRRAGFKAGE